MPLGPSSQLWDNTNSGWFYKVSSEACVQITRLYYLQYEKKYIATSILTATYRMGSNKELAHTMVRNIFVCFQI